MNKIILLLVLLFMTQQNVYSKEVPVKIKPAYKITTSNLDLKEGDSLDFVITEDVLINSKPYLKKGVKVSGLVTNIEDNGYFVQPANIYIENFKTQNEHPIKFKGIIYKSGNDHNEVGEIFFFDFLRGGEVQIEPEKDEFTIYLEENL